MLYHRRFAETCSSLESGAKEMTQNWSKEDWLKFAKNAVLVLSTFTWASALAGKR